MILKKKDKEIYKKIIDEQHYCQLCGSTNWLEIHHILYRSQGGNNDERNLIRLCKNCHELVHSNKKKWQKFLIDKQKNKYGEFDEKELLKSSKKLF